MSALVLAILCRSFGRRFVHNKSSAVAWANLVLIWHSPKSGCITFHEKIDSFWDDVEVWNVVEYDMIGMVSMLKM